MFILVTSLYLRCSELSGRGERGEGEGERLSFSALIIFSDVLDRPGQGIVKVDKGVEG